MSGFELCGNKAMDRARKLEPLAKLEPLSPRRPSMMDPAFMKDAIPLVPAGARPSKGPCVCSGDADHGGMRWRKLASDAERQAMRFFVECMLPPQLQPKGELGVGDAAARFCDRPACVFAAFSAWWMAPLTKLLITGCVFWMAFVSYNVNSDMNLFNKPIRRLAGHAQKASTAITSKT